MLEWLPIVSAITGPAILGIIIWTSIVRPIRARRAGKKRQKVVDHISQMLSDAIHNILNRSVEDVEQMAQWEEDFRKWCDEVSGYLGEHFTKAEQDHFNQVGLVPMIRIDFAHGDKHEHFLRQLGIKFDRLRDIIRDNQFRE